MLKATVTGRIWSTKKLGDVPTGSILEVQVDELVNTAPRLRSAGMRRWRDGSSWQRAPLPPHGFRASHRPSMR